MRQFYSLLIGLFQQISPLLKLLNPKLKLFFEGRKNLFDKLKNDFAENSGCIWIHAASLGEYEQAVPIIEKLKTEYSHYKILVTFFSPSGYEVKKNNSIADFVSYLPLDTSKNAQKFLEIVQPKIAIFVKYEVWPNFMLQLKRYKISSILVSGVFRENQLFFKPYGKFIRRALQSFDHLFVQDKNSKKILIENGFQKVSLSGDTRFDRVTQQLNYNNELDFLAEFKQGKKCMICGSTWPEDEKILAEYINSTSEDIKFIIAPHQIHKDKIQSLQQSLKKPSILYSEKNNKSLSSYQVFILDTIGLLSKAYSYAEIAYVGGAMGKTGLHNILEPATFGIPIIIRKNFKKFPEASKLQQEKGLFSIASYSELKKIIDELINNEAHRIQAGKNAKNFIVKRIGATEKIMSYIRQKI